VARTSLILTFDPARTGLTGEQVGDWLMAQVARTTGSLPSRLDRTGALDSHR
jgi:hypothetical protein